MREQKEKFLCVKFRRGVRAENEGRMKSIQRRRKRPARHQLAPPTVSRVLLAVSINWWYTNRIHEKDRHFITRTHSNKCWDLNKLDGQLVVISYTIGSTYAICGHSAGFMRDTEFSKKSICRSCDDGAVVMLLGRL
jgi:hypothetical protein